MSSPITRSVNPIKTSFSSTLELTVSSASPDDVYIVYLEGVDWFNANAQDGFPILPGGLTTMYSTVGTGGFKYLGYGRVPPGGLGGKVTITAGATQTTSGGWWGTVDVIGNVAWKQPGWLQTDLSGANYATYTRADLASVTTTYSIRMQVAPVSLGVTQWFAGWANADMGFGMNTSNQLTMFINNTLGNPIGNAASTAAVPGALVDKKMWLRGDINITTGAVTYYYSYDPVPLVASADDHWTQLGTTVAGTNGGTTPRVTNSDTFFIGTRNTGVAPFGGKVYSVVESVASVPTLEINFSNPAPGGLAMVGTGNHIRSTTQTDGDLPFEEWSMCDGICFLDADAVNTLDVDVQGSDRLIHYVFRGGSFVGHTEVPILGPAQWRAWADRSAKIQNLYVKHVTRTLATSVDVPAAVASADGNYAWNYHHFVFIGKQAVIVYPPQPQSDVMRLGCADSYSVWVTANDYATTIDEFKWKEITWERVLDDVSEARVVLPDHLGGVHCIARLGNLQPWGYGIRIERNDQEVWSGPIRNVRRQGTAIVVSAADTLARMQKRLVIRNAPVPYTDADAGLIFSDVINYHSRQPADPWLLQCPTFTVNVPVTRTLRPRGGKIAWDLLSELLDSAVDAYMMNGVLYVWEPNGGWQYVDQIKRTLPGPYNTDFEMVYSTFTEEAFSERPDWTIDGAGQGNFVISATTDVGELGFRQFETAEDVASQEFAGVLDLIDPNPLEVPEDEAPAETSKVLKARAQSLLDLRSMAPVVIEGGVLSRDAPIDVNNLRPGALWVLDVYDHGYGQLLAVNRLRRVSVSVTMGQNGIEEKVTPALYPPGWSGDMGDI